jgi:hypothetical protein
MSHYPAPRDPDHTRYLVLVDARPIGVGDHRHDPLSAARAVYREEVEEAVSVSVQRLGDSQ